MQIFFFIPTGSAPKLYGVCLIQSATSLYRKIKWKLITEPENVQESSWGVLVLNKKILISSPTVFLNNEVNYLLNTKMTARLGNVHMKITSDIFCFLPLWDIGSLSGITKNYKYYVNWLLVLVGLFWFTFLIKQI